MNGESKVYVASLSDHNAGILHGAWIDVADLDEESFLAAVSAMLDKSPTARATGMLADPDEFDRCSWPSMFRRFLGTREAGGS